MIIFKKVRYKNFLSTGDQWSEINFTDSSSTLIIGANGSVGKSCVNNLKDDNDLVLISRSEFDSEVEGNFEKNVLDINDYTNTESFIQSINYEISGIIFAIGSINLKPFSNTSVDDFKKINFCISNLMLPF